MRCRKCGKEIDSTTTFCPACGIRIREEVDLDELTNEIAGKVDLFMNEDEVKKSAGPGPDDDDLDKTITRSYGVQEEADSVFDDLPDSFADDDTGYAGRADVSEKRSSYDNWGSEYDDTPERETPRRSGDTSSKKKKGNTGLIIGIIAAAVVIVVLVIALLFAKGIFGGKTEEETDASSDVLTCSAADGEEYSAPLEIILTSGQGLRIYYTLDGSEPSTKSDQYTGTITLDDSYITDDDGTQITLKAVSYTENSILSGELEITFTLVYAEIASPEISPSSGAYTSATTITITAESGAKIYYTTDGSTPTESSELYTGAFEMERGNSVISAIAVKNGLTSSVATVVYDLEIASVYTFSQAKDIILDYLISTGEVENTDGDLVSSQTDENGDAVSAGYVDFADGGTCIIDNDQYIVVQCYFYDENGGVTENRIYGVDDQTGEYVLLTQTGTGYSKK